MSEEEWGHPVFATEQEFEDRMNELLLEESDEPEQWWYLSFAGEKGFLGGCYVKARGVMGATLTARFLGINPGGEVMSYGPIIDSEMDENVPKRDRWRLLNEQEVKR